MAGEKRDRGKGLDSGAADFIFCGIRINNLTRQEALQEIGQILHKKEPSLIVTPNAYHFVLLEKDELFLRAYKRARLVLPDGMSLVFISRLFGHPLKERVAGSDLFPDICALAASQQKRLFLLGGERNSEKIALQKIRKIWPQLEVTAYSPPPGFEKDAGITEKIISLIRSFSPDILCCFVGSPKSEKWLIQNFDQLQVNLAVSLGATLNYFAGIKRRAPSWMRQLGLEWAWRLAQEPRRLARRYLVGNFQFLYLVFKEILKQKGEL